MNSYTVNLSERDQKRLRQLTGKSGDAAVAAALNGVLHAPKSKRPLGRGAKRFTSARAAIAYLEREAGI